MSDPVTDQPVLKHIERLVSEEHQAERAGGEIITRRGDG